MLHLNMVLCKLWMIVHSYTETCSAQQRGAFTPLASFGITPILSDHAEHMRMRKLDRHIRCALPCRTVLDVSREAWLRNVAHTPSAEARPLSGSARVGPFASQTSKVC